MKHVFSSERYHMNWFRDDYKYADITCPDELSYKVQNIVDKDVLRTKIIFKNTSPKPYFTVTNSIGILFPLNDRYEDSQLCMTNRCHSHVFCGGNISYIMALRMGGTAPHLGMVLTQGSLCHYSIVRDNKGISNDRGCFVLHPSPMELMPEEEAVIEWVVFPHNGKADFYKQLPNYSRFVDVTADKYVAYENERNTIYIKPSFAAKKVTINGEELCNCDGTYKFDVSGECSGEIIYEITVDEVKTNIKLLIIPQLYEIARKRCEFISNKQQYFGKCDQLNGAYLIYDNEEEHLIYNKTNDWNGGRERIGMGVLIARFLQSNPDKALQKSLEHYIEYIEREIVKVDTGEVFNDIGYTNGRNERMYNYPWVITFYIELYKLFDEKKYIEYALNITRTFYKRDKRKYYAIDIPAVMLCRELEKAGMAEEYEEMLGLFKSHADKIIEIGTKYPASEVNYEQAIVAPAADILLQVYLLTKEEKYLNGGKIQLEVLELFNGLQPDYHLYETAIRHWDGYWFGKRKMLGDTFPHYWSSLTGNVYARYAQMTEHKEYFKKAEASLRGVLSMISPDGRASCAYLYPYSVNGVKADCADDWANDQDWGLYFMIRYTEEMNN